MLLAKGYAVELYAGVDANGNGRRAWLLDGVSVIPDEGHGNVPDGWRYGGRIDVTNKWRRQALKRGQV